MSYGAFARGHDIQIGLDENSFECESCKLADKLGVSPVILRGYDEVIEHLKLHIAEGHNIPSNIIPALERAKLKAQGKPTKTFEVGLKGKNLIVEGVTFDLSGYQGKKVTVFEGMDGVPTIEDKPTHQTTICELTVPQAVITAEETGKVDDMGTPVTKEVIAPLDLGKIAIKRFEEVA